MAGGHRVALLEVLEALQASGVEDRVRTAAQMIYQVLIGAVLSTIPITLRE